MRLKTILLVSLSFISCSAFNVFTQQKWEIYTSFREVKSVSLQGNKVWAASTGGLFSFDYTNPSATISKLTSLDGLQSNDLSSVTVSMDGRVWAGASDGSISVYNPATGVWRQISDIRASAEPSRRINAFYQYNNLMFFSTEFCIVKFSIPQFQFVDQPYISLGPLLPIKSPVYDILVLNDTIWAATKNGIAYANINTNLPIQSNWRNYTTNNSVLNRNLINCIEKFSGAIYFGTDSGMVRYENATLVKYEPLVNGQPFTDPVYRMTVVGNDFYFSAYNNLDGYKVNFRIFKVSSSNINLAELVYTGLEVNSMESDAQGDLILGTAGNGVDIFRNGQNNFIIPNGPNSNVFQDMSIDINGDLWAVSGGVNAGIYKFDVESKTWKNYSTEQYPWMRGNDFRHIYGSKFNNTVWAGGFGTGLLRISGDSLTLFNNENSCLQPFEGNFTLAEGIEEDNSGNLWVINRASIVPIVKFIPEPCLAYPTPQNQTVTTMIYMAIDKFRTKWMTLPPDLPNSPRGVVYFNENINPQGAIISPAQLGANIGTANHVVVDRNGEVWVATDNGISIIRNPQQVINNPGSIPFTEKMRIIEGGLSTPLTENVQFVAVDALNNKWIGTVSSGLLYVSPDGSTLLARYNVSNSPLTDNRILSIIVSPKTGVAYFGTQKGLVSLQTIAVEPLSECGKITAGPNPFEIPGNTTLKIDGLVAESTVKILSVSGTLVAEFQSPGGRIAEWDGRDMNGNYVSSGVYIIAGYNKDASKVCTGKVAVIRK
ncbi:MAG: hypothetical protein N2510_00215 [Ignavibacteria bacterium]|nr:hypothetical protein [Ignavibacteria bacterium]